MGRIRRKFVIETTWECDSCKHKNRGRDLICANCGNPKQKGEKYAVPDPKTVPEVTGQDLLRKAQAGPNWKCEFCGADERTLEDHCGSCGAERYSYSSSKKPPALVPPQLRDTITSSPRRRRWPFIAGGGGLVVLLTGLLVWINTAREVDAKVAVTSWEVAVTLEKRYLRSGTGWSDDMPAGAFNSSCERRQAGTENCNPYRCNPHEVNYDCNPHDCNPHQESYDCNPEPCNCNTDCTDEGNGFATCTEDCDTCYDTCYRTEYDTCHDSCSRTEYDTCYEQCPVYKNWCNYQYHEWVPQESERAAGFGPTVVWPTLLAEGVEERIVRSEEYSVIFTDSEDSWTYKPRNLGEFQQYIPETYWTIEVNRLGTVTPITILDRSVTD